MAEQVFGKTDTKTVSIATDLSAKQGYLVNLDATTYGLVALATDATKFPYPLVDGKDGSVTAATGAIAVGGECRVKIGGTVTVAAALTSDGNGKGIACTTEGQLYGAVALENGVADDIITVKVTQGFFAN